MVARIKAAANRLLGRVPFPYARATNGGRKGCAQVVSTALKEAGVLNKTTLGVLPLMSDLQSKGWRKVGKNNIQDGDVVTWATYDRDGDGRKDANTHVGIVVRENGQLYVVNNSSSRRRPIKMLLASYPAPITGVLRNSTVA